MPVRKFLHFYTCACPWGMEDRVPAIPACVAMGKVAQNPQGSSPALPATS